MWQFIKTILLVTLITGLIWLYAEGEVVNSHDIDLDVRFVPAAGRQLDIQPSGPQRVRMTFRSTTSIAAELERDLRSKVVTLEISDDPNRGDGPQTVFLKERLAGVPPLSELGLNIKDVQPAQMDVEVERLVTLKLPVAVVADGVQLGSGPVADPAEVKVTIPASVAAKWDKSIKAEAKLGRAMIAGLDVNQPHVLDVPLTLPPHTYAADRAQFLPATAKVTITIRSQTDHIVLPVVPIRFSCPPKPLERLFPVFDENQLVLRDVALTGPSEVIDRIRKEQFHVVAEVQLSADELDAASTKDQTTAQPVIIVPPGVTVDGPPAAVHFKVLKRS